VAALTPRPDQGHDDRRRYAGPYSEAQSQVDHRRYL